MLLEFSCSNHRSILGYARLSMTAGPDPTMEDRQIRFGKERVLRCAVLYGANGSGKSNFLDGIRFTRELVTESGQFPPDRMPGQVPHRLADPDRESVYAVEFVTQGIRWTYGFTLRAGLVEREHLFCFPNGRQTRIFEREGTSVHPGRIVRSGLGRCVKVLRPNQLLLSCAAGQDGASSEVLAAYRFFEEELVLYDAARPEEMLAEAVNCLRGDPARRELLTALLRSLGLPARDIAFPQEPGASAEKSIPSARMVYDGYETDLVTEESAGVRHLVAWLTAFLDAVSNDRVLLWEDAAAGLHPNLLAGLLQAFLSQEPKAGNSAQLIFTSQDATLLDRDLFRRDQIWLTERQEPRGQTRMYALSEVKNVRKGEKYGRNYLAGRYGGVPAPDGSLGELLSGL